MTKRALVTGWWDSHVYLVGFEGTGGEPQKAMTKIDTWIRRPHHPWDEHWSEGK